MTEAEKYPFFLKMNVRSLCKFCSSASEYGFGGSVNDLIFAANSVWSDSEVPGKRDRSEKRIVVPR